MENWEVRIYESGTHIVTRNNLRKPHLYVYADKRRDVCHELKNWLNGNKEPEWLQHLKIHKDSKEACIGPDGIDISAVGPLILPDNDNGKLNWQTDMSKKAKQDRVELIDKLLKRCNNGLDN